jgi:hypothetical protein
LVVPVAVRGAVRVAGRTAHVWGADAGGVRLRPGRRRDGLSQLAVLDVVPAQGLDPTQADLVLPRLGDGDCGGDPEAPLVEVEGVVRFVRHGRLQGEDIDVRVVRHVGGAPSLGPPGPCAEPAEADSGQPGLVPGLKVGAGLDLDACAVACGDVVAVPLHPRSVMDVQRDSHQALGQTRPGRVRTQIGQRPRPELVHGGPGGTYRGSARQDLDGRGHERKWLHVASLPTLAVVRGRYGDTGPGGPSRLAGETPTMVLDPRIRRVAQPVHRGPSKLVVAAPMLAVVRPWVRGLPSTPAVKSVGVHA